MRHASHQIDKTYRVANGRLLLRNWQMRPAVGFVFDHPRRAVGMPVRGLAAFFVLFVVEVRLDAALPDKVACQRHIARLLCYLIQTHQRQLNFRVARIAVQLIFAVAESAVDMIGRATNDV